MLVLVTMRLCNNAVLAVLLAVAVLALPAQQPPAPAKPAQTPAPASAPAQAPAQAPPLTVDRDPVRTPDSEAPAPEQLRKNGEGFVLHTDVEEVVLNATVLEGTRLVPDLKRDNFE